MKNDKSQFVVRTSDFYLSLFICHLSFDGAPIREESQRSDEGGAGKKTVRFEILPGCSSDHAVWQLRPGWLLVEMDALEVVAYILLIEGRLRSAGTVEGARPEARGVRRQDFIAEDDFTVVDAELKFCICYDNPFGKRIGRRLQVEGKRQALQLVRSFFPDNPDHFLEGNVDIVAFLGLRGRGEQWFGQLVAFPKPGRQFDSADAPGFAVLLPAGPDEIPAGNAFDGEHLGLQCQHAAEAQHLAMRLELVRKVIGIRGNEMIWDRVPEHIKPEAGELGEHGPLHRDRRRQHDVER